eukprot:9918737-Prorocentrum_lima.AAC.1
MDLTNQAYDELDVKYHKAMNDHSASNIEAYEKAEEKFLSRTDYQACIEHGDKQTEYLEALDFMDILTEKI